MARRLPTPGAITCLALLYCCISLAGEAPPPPAPPTVSAKSYVLMDYSTGQVLAESRPSERLAPASLTKLMTAYVVFQALQQGSLTLHEQVVVGENAWRKPGSRTFLDLNSRLAVEDLIRGMVVQSGNDASVALAEHIAGSEAAFADLMNHAAQILGMDDTAFRNVTGLPADGHYSTAQDVAVLARTLIAEFPEFYHFYSEREFTFNGITQHNRNSLLWRDESVDGLKTGYTASAGYCMVSSADRSGMRLIAVVMGADSDRLRDTASQALLDYGFAAFETHNLYDGGQELAAARVWKGSTTITPLGLSDDLYVVIPRGQYAALSAVMRLPARLVAPLAANTPVGEVLVSIQGKPIASAPLVALEGVEVGNLWRRWSDEFIYRLD